jgi:hypothetical protein
MSMLLSPARMRGVGSKEEKRKCERGNRIQLSSQAGVEVESFGGPVSAAAASVERPNDWPAASQRTIRCLFASPDIRLGRPTKSADMIKNRPAILLADSAYVAGPRPPYRLDWRAVPELVRASMLDLGGIQPITKAMFQAAGGKLFDKPSEGEIALFRERGTESR